MYTLKNEVTNELVIKNSKFITIILHINNKNEINIKLEKIKKEFPKATHYCYALIIDDYKKSSDDGEPSGTAGIPILNILEYNKLNYVLAIVIRYFGGIKLGTGGLARAYSKSIKKVLEKNNLIELIEGKKIQIEFNYDEQKQLDYILKNSKITNKEFNEKIIYIVEISNKDINKLSNYNYEIVKDIYI